MNIAYLIKPNTLNHYRVEGVKSAISKLLREGTYEFWDVRTYKNGHYTPKDLNMATKVFVDLGTDTFNLNIADLTRGVIKEIHSALCANKDIYGIYKRQVDNTYQAYRLNYLLSTPGRIDFLGKDPELSKSYSLDNRGALITKLYSAIMSKNPEDLQESKQTTVQTSTDMTKVILQSYKDKVLSLQAEVTQLKAELRLANESRQAIKQQMSGIAYGARNISTHDMWNPLNDTHTTVEPDYREQQEALIKERINNAKVSLRHLIKL